MSGNVASTSAISELPMYRTQTQIQNQQSSNKKNYCYGCLGITFITALIVCIAAYSLLTVITGIITLASDHSFDGTKINGFNGIAQYCGDKLRNMVLAYIVMAVLVGYGSAKHARKRSSDDIAVAGLATFIFHVIIASIITAFYVESNHGVCQTYMDVTKTSINAPYYVVINQIAFSWIIAFIGLIIGIVGCICK